MPRVALALAGGGPLGAIYEIGALCALEESLAGIRFAELDAYVGVSAGGRITPVGTSRITTICEFAVWKSVPVGVATMVTHWPGTAPHVGVVLEGFCGGAV